MNKYINGYIYVIKCNVTKQLYIGSSCIPKELRLMKHLTDFKSHVGINKKFRPYRSSFEVLYSGDYEMIEIEKYPCNSKQELEIRETLWIEKYRDKIVNKRLPVNINNILVLDPNLFS